MRFARRRQCVKASRRSRSLHGRHEGEPSQYDRSADASGMSPCVGGSSVRMRIAMNATNSVEPTVVGGGLAVAFELIAAGRVVKCTVSRESLQHYFWLQPGADDARVLKIFNDGRQRIVAVAERKARRFATASIHLEAADFQR